MRAWLQGRRRKRAIILVVILAGFSVSAEIVVGRAARGRVFADCASLPNEDVALVLGTSCSVHGYANPFYEARLDAAAELNRTGRVRGIVVSGDNSRTGYNEPADMKRDRVRRGVPARLITCDYAGRRTLDSMQRISRVFGQTRVIVVSQRFHLERALFLAQATGIEAVGYVAREAPARWALPVRCREVIARDVAVIDRILGRGPRFLGPREPVALSMR